MKTENRKIDFRICTVSLPAFLRDGPAPAFLQVTLHYFTQYTFENDNKDAYPSKLTPF